MPKIVKEISKRRKYVHGPKGKIEPLHKKVKNYKPKKTAGKVARVAGLGAIDLSWFLFCLGKYTAKDLHTVLLDNKIIDSMQKKHKNLKIQDSDSKFKQFFKKFEKSNPRTAATLKLWMLYSLLTLMSVGGIKLAQRDKDDNKQEKIEQIVDEKIQDNPIEEAIIYDEDDLNNNKNDIAEDIEPVVPNNEIKYNVTENNFTQSFINDNWDDIVVCLLEFETWRDKPKKQSDESRYTYGAGLTWVYTKDKNGKIVQHKCLGSYEQKASNFSTAQKMDQMKYHCEYETLPGIKSKLTKYDFSDITNQQLLGLFVAGYQLPAKLDDGFYYDTVGKKCEYIGIVHKLSDAGSNVQKQVDAFIAGPEVKTKWRPGTNKRRWWCAMIYMGYITPDDLIDMDRDAFSSIDINTVLKNGHFVYDASTIEYVLAHAKNSNRGSVRKFINDRNIQLKGNFVTHKKSSVNNSQNNPSMMKTIEGLNAFKAKDYKKAIVYYQEAISLDADNIEAYSSLALCYKKLGDQTHSISDYEKVLEVVKACNAQMNSNRGLLHDPDVKASIYYNSGLAREEIAKLQEKDNKIKDAIENYNKAGQNFKTAYDNAKDVDNAERMEIYQNAKERVENAANILKSKDKTTSKASAFKKGKIKILNKSVVRNTDNSRD